MLPTSEPPVAPSSGARCRPGSPPARPPLAEMRPLGADRGVLAVPRVDPGLVRECAEQPLLDVVDQAGEPRRVLLRVADPAGEEAVPGEHVHAGVAGSTPD